MALDFYGLGLDARRRDLVRHSGACMVVEIGLIAPPVGLNVYVIHSLASDVPMAETYRGRRAVSHYRCDPRHSAVSLFPVLSLWLVRLIT